MSAQSKIAFQVVLLAALILPVLLYAIRIYGSGADEVRRYHYEMASLEKELRHSLDTLGEVVVSASQLNQKNEIPAFNQQAGELLSQDRVSLQRSVALVDSKERPRSNCLIGWVTSPEKLLLQFKVDWPIGNHETDGAESQGDVRLRYSGAIKVAKVLEESRKVTNFDALLVADQNGELIQKFGPDAEYFSALPSLGEDWDKAFETSREADGSAGLFLPTASSVKRDIAGRNYVIFPRAVVLRPGSLEEEPLSCRAEARDGEVLRLRIVGLIDSKRLSMLAVRPSETLYWCVVFYYGLLAFIFVDFKRRPVASDPDGPQLRGSWTGADQLRWVTLTGFGLALGIFLAASFKLYREQDRVDRSLKVAAADAVMKASDRLATLQSLIDGAQGTGGDQPGLIPFESNCPGLARCARIDRSGWMTAYRFGSRSLQGRNLSDREYFQQALQASENDGFVIQPIYSRASGLRDLVVAKKKSWPYLDEFDCQMKEKQEVRSITSSLLGPYEPAPDVGVALVDAQAAAWPVLFSSEAFRQAEQDLLRQFSDAPCLRVGEQERRGGYCSGLLHGRPARLWIREIEGPNYGRLSRIQHSGRLMVVSAQFQDRFNARLAASLQVTVVLGLLAFLAINLLIFALGQFRKKSFVLPVASPTPATGSGLEKWVAAVRPTRRILTKLAYVFLFSVLGGFILLGCWSIEDCWQERLNLRSESSTRISIASSCSEAHPEFAKSGPTAKAGNVCVEFEEKHRAGFRIPQLSATSSSPGGPSMEIYRSLRPWSGRYLDMVSSSSDENVSDCRFRPVDQNVAWRLDGERARWDCGYSSRWLPSSPKVFFALRQLVAGLLLVIFVFQPKWLGNSLGSQPIGGGSILTFGIVALVLLLFRQELLAVLTGFFGSVDKIHGVFEQLWKKVTKS